MASSSTDSPSSTPAPAEPTRSPAGRFVKGVGGPTSTRWQKGQSGNPLGPAVRSTSAEAKRLLSSISERAAQRVIELVESKDEAVALKAANSVLDRDLGKPHQSLTVDNEGGNFTLRQKLEGLTPDELRTLAQGIAVDLQAAKGAGVDLATLAGALREVDPDSLKALAETTAWLKASGLDAQSFLAIARRYAAEITADAPETK